MIADCWRRIERWRERAKDNGWDAVGATTVLSMLDPE